MIDVLGYTLVEISIRIENARFEMQRNVDVFTNRYYQKAVLQLVSDVFSKGEETPVVRDARTAATLRR